MSTTPKGPDCDNLSTGDTHHEMMAKLERAIRASKRKRLDLAGLPSEDEQERRWQQDICVMCGVEPITGESFGARYCGPICRQLMTALRQKAQRLGVR